MNWANVVYKVNGRFWDVASAKYVEVPAAGKDIIELFQGGHPADEAYLARTLVFYNCPLGEFASKYGQKSLEDRLKELEAEMASIKEQLRGVSSETETSTNGGLSYGV